MGGGETIKENERDLAQKRRSLPRARRHSPLPEVAKKQKIKQEGGQRGVPLGLCPGPRGTAKMGLGGGALLETSFLIALLTTGRG